MGNRSNINLVGNTTQGQNVGSGEGVYKGKNLGNTLQYKSLSVTGTTMAITCDDNNIYFSAATGGGGGTTYWSSGATGLYPTNNEDLLLAENSKLKWGDNSCIRSNLGSVDVCSTGTTTVCGGANVRLCSTGVELQLSGSGYMVLGTQTVYLNGTGGGYINTVTASKCVELTGNACYDMKLVGGGSSDASSGGNVDVCGGINSSTGDGGNVLIQGGVSTSGTTGRVIMNGLPAKTSETCGIYIDGSGNLSTGLISGGTGGGSGFTISNNGLCDNGSTTVGLGGTLLNDTTISGGDSFAFSATCMTNICLDTNGGTVSINQSNGGGTNSVIYGCGSCVSVGATNVVIQPNFAGNVTQNISGAGCHIFSGGDVYMPDLATCTSETNVLYVNAAGQISSGATGGGGSLISGYTCVTNNSVSIGDGAFPYDSDSLRDIAIGCGALRLNTSGDDNIGIGANALCSNTSGYDNVAIGSSALCTNALRFGHVAIGKEASFTTSFGCHTVAIGYQANRSAVNATNSVAIGNKAMYFGGSCNIAIGICTIVGSENTANNVAIGPFVMCGASFGTGNVGIGSCALCTTFNGNNNTAIGANAGRYIEGSSNVMIGYNAGATPSASGSCCLIISNNVGALIFGDFSTNCIYNGGDTANWDVSSDCRIKESVTGITNALSTISNLNPISFDYTSGYTATRNWDENKRVGNHGFLAQEFETVFPKYVGCTQGEIASGSTVSDFRSINTSHLVPILVKAIQELEARIQALEA